MKIIKLSQTKDREAWLELRREKITGTRAKKVKPLSRGADRVPAEFWQMVADRIAITKDGELERERGERLQEEALNNAAKSLALKIDTDAGMWVSDKDEDIAVSPDSAEPGDKPTYAIEAKCLDSKNHIKGILMDKRAAKLPDYNPYESLNFDPKCDFRFQAVQYFVVNEHLKTLYVTLYDDRIVLNPLVQHTIAINREHVGDQIAEQEAMELDVLKELREVIKELKNV